jgi:Ser/Thr protein kinase RdoA (MazF antagonist)
VHGDFHYANVLWNDKKISGILDFELSGYGNKEFDIAWAIIVRPSQEFLKEQIEIDSFISGYQSIGQCNLEYLEYYMVLIYSWFYELGGPKYKHFVANKMYEIINN